MSGDRTGPEDTGGSSPTVLLRRAEDLLRDGATDQAIADAYAAVRTHLQESYGLPDSLSHREFLAACGDRLDEEAYQSLASLATAYERQFFTAVVDDVDGTDAVRAAKRVLDDEV